MLREPALRGKGTARGALELRSRAIALSLIAALVASPARPIPQTPFPGSQICGEGGSGHGARARREGATRVALRFVRPAPSRDERGNVVRETDPRGRVVVRTFDPRNNRLSETEAYDPASPPDPIPTTTWAYDPEDNLLSTTDPLGNTTAYTYNATRQVLTTTDARGGTTTNAYDAKGNLVSTTDPLGNATAYTYDTRGNVLTQTVTVGGVAARWDLGDGLTRRLALSRMASGHRMAIVSTTVRRH
jgi:YD repeat-containing protein